ncbi:hypothetical protein MXD58_028135, partial [Frankia sp. AgKG'84/4]|nr:hypothetical protein [Frankia sp. AgKG'84/4]
AGAGGTAGAGDEVPAPAGGSQLTAAATPHGGRPPTLPSLLVWVVGLTVAVTLGGALGVGAHLLAAALRRRRARPAWVDRAVAPYPSAPPGWTDRVPASTGRESGHP